MCAIESSIIIQLQQYNLISILTHVLDVQTSVKSGFIVQVSKQGSFPQVLQDQIQVHVHVYVHVTVHVCVCTCDYTCMYLYM